MNDRSRPLPRLLSPRLPIGTRWARFCRSEFAAHLRASVRGAYSTVLVVSAALTFYVGINAAAGLYMAFGGTL
ncbi:hypothetical protein QOZ88_19370 [Blastococcus sp. BMG 814]|uniref:Uncharacterized protein n=1 Tax=Blastococcus carthaginiensis TaxID=3050034 RepID=A0ABT9IGU9_9ACTN|nr:hypothetical protein [Blastococcus carthaginiensis]MDP5184799.1 hypothetical protein [Blastococcus carthaginiensis]